MHTRSPMCNVSCRSRPDCPFRCNLICTPIILCFSGGCVSRAVSQHVDLLSPSICHCLSLTFTSSLSLCLSPICVGAPRNRHYTYTCPASVPTSPLLHPPLPRPYRLTHQGLFGFALPFWEDCMWLLSSLFLTE